MLKPSGIRVLICCLVLALAAMTAALADTQTVSVDATNVSLANVLTDISNQTGIGIYLGEAPGENLETVSVEDVSIEEAIHAAARAGNCSWVRLYVLEAAEGAEECDFDKLVRAAANSRRERFKRMSEEMRNTVAERAGEMMDAADNDGDTAPAGGWRASASPTGAVEGPADKAARWAMSDSLRFVISLDYTDPAGVKVAGGDFPAFSDAFAEATGFIILDRFEQFRGTISLDMAATPVDEIVAAVAEQMGCNWRRVYLVAHVRHLTDAEVEQRLDNMFTSGMNYFWSQPEEKRAEIIEQIIERSDELTPDQLTKVRSSRIARKMVSKFMTYANTLSMQQRRELVPLLQQAARIMVK